jgi:ATP-dependent helicase HrpA
LKRQELSINRSRGVLIEALDKHQVIIVQGATGCGKTTQIPQIVRDSGLFSDDLIIGVTQPRRIAAVSVACRIAQERDVRMGDEVAYAIRFDDKTTPTTRIKVMTDGLLLQEFRTDPDLSRYSVIMVDEAHERSLNIDFTLGLLRDLLKRRDDLRVIVSSATINADVFTHFFNGAPNIVVDAHAYPIDIRWHPIAQRFGPDRDADVANVIAGLHRNEPKGDILVFLTGEGEIKRTITQLEAMHLGKIAYVPLYGRLTRQQQESVFDPTPGKRKVVLSTNIAETSLTIEGIRYVVDIGLAKMPSFDRRTGFSLLRELPISQASARQRAGRSGRTAPGVCVRLYAEDDFEERDPYPTEDIRRMDLSEVVLRLIDLGIQDVESFPFITPPSGQALRDAVRDLMDLGAIDSARNLTAFGRRMVPFPLPPRLACMIVTVAEETPDVFEEILTVGALLSVRWPQITPQGEEDEARRVHKAFAHPAGDLAMGLALIRSFTRAKDKDLFCETNFLDRRLMDEIFLIRDQLLDIAKAAGLMGSSGGKFAGVARALLRAFARGICIRTGRSSYETQRGVRVAIHPGSCLWDVKPHYFVATDIMVTSRAWARAVTTIEPGWILDFDPDLAHRWKIRGASRGGRDRRREAPSFPSSLEIWDQRFSVKKRRNGPMATIPWKVLRDNADEGVPVLDAQFERLTVAVTHDDATLLKGVSLQQALRLAPLLRLAEPEIEGWPEGELYVAEWELHHILRRLPDLMRVVRSRRRKRAAFLTLIPNGAGGYWYDAAGDLRMAIDQSALAVASLMREPTVGQDDQIDLQAQLSKLETIKELLS